LAWWWQAGQRGAKSPASRVGAWGGARGNRGRDKARRKLGGRGWGKKRVVRGADDGKRGGAMAVRPVARGTKQLQTWGAAGREERTLHREREREAAGRGGIGEGRAVS